MSNIKKVEPFLKQLKALYNAVPYVKSNRDAKCFISRAMKSSDCTGTQVLAYFQTLLDENKPGYDRVTLKNNDWKKIVIKRSENTNAFGQTLKMLLEKAEHSKKCNYYQLFLEATKIAVKDPNFYVTEARINYLGWMKLLRCLLVDVVMDVEEEQTQVTEQMQDSISPSVKPTKHRKQSVKKKKEKQQQATKTHRSKKVSVAQYDVNNKFIASYPSLSDAAEKTGIPHCSISKAINGSYKYAGGYRWEKVSC